MHKTMKSFPFLAGVGLLVAAGAGVGTLLHAQQGAGNPQPGAQTLAGAQHGDEAAASGLQPVQQGRDAAPGRRPVRVEPRQDQPAGFDAGQWRQRLQQQDLGAREESYMQLLERARRDERVAEEVRAWSRGADELAWTARLMLRELDRRGARGAVRTFRDDGMADLQERMRVFQERMDRMRAEFDRDLQRMFDERDQGRGYDEQPAPDARRQDDPFMTLEELFERRREARGAEQQPGGGAGPRTDGGQPGPRPQALPPRAFEGRAQSKSVEATQGPDGARIEVKEWIDGREERRVYEGKTLDEIWQQHPELKEQQEIRIEIGDGGSQRVRVGPNAEPEARGRPQEGLLVPVPRGGRLVEAAPREGVLGIMCQPAGEELRKQLSLPATGGLVVESVVDGTIAAQVGLQKGDVLVELGGRTVGSREEVAEVLAGRRAGEDLVIVVVDAQGRRRTLTHRGR